MPGIEKCFRTEKGRLAAGWFLDGKLYFENDHSEIVRIYGRIPTLVVDDDVDSTLTVMHKGGRIFIGSYFIDNTVANYNDTSTVICRADGEVVFVGTVNDFMFFLGLEESHHGYIYPDSIPLFVNPLSVPMCLYDAQKHEFAALIYQLEVAIKENKPAETINHLRKRIKKAKEIRETFDIFRNDGFICPQDIPV